MLRHTLGFALAIVTIALGVSCSSDSNEANNGAGAAGGAGGSGGSSGSSGAAGSGGGTEDAGGIPCGNERCMPMGTSQACCLDQFTSKCGIRGATGGCAEPPAPEDPRCPSVTVPVIGKLSSCCTASGDCGIIGPAGFGGGGCTELGEAQRQANMFTGDGGGFRFDAGAFGDAGFMFDGGFGITFPPPQKCDR